MKMNPLTVFTGLTLATLAALVVVEKDKWMGAPLPVAKVEPAPIVEAPKAAEPAKVEEVAKVEEPAKITAPAEEKKSIPSFDTVRVEATGESIIAGQAEPGAEVTIKYNGTAIGTAIANADGAFVVTPEKPLPTGPGALSLEMKSKDIVVASADTVAVDVKAGAESTPMVAVLTPDKPTTLIQMPTTKKSVLPPMNTVNLDSVDYDEQGNIVFSGRGPSGSKVQVYVDNAPYALADIGADGTWTMPGGTPLTIGAHELRADEIDVDGKVTSRVAMPFYREDPKKLPTAVAAAPVVPAPATNLVVTMVDKTAETPVVSPPASATTTIEIAKTPEVVAVAPVAETPVAVAPAAETPAVVAPAATPTPPAVEPAKVEPAPAATPVVVAEAKAPSQIIIQPGNNLWKLSRKIYGKGTMYTVIYEANKDQIRKPGLIYPGQVFLTPDAAKTP